jgi:hypothetical protein
MSPRNAYRPIWSQRSIPHRLFLALLLAAAAWLLVACSGSEGRVRRSVESAAAAVEEGLNQGDRSKVEPFFATEAEGANAAGLADTWGALQTFAEGLTPSDRVQVHSFEITEVEVHEGGDLARAGYRLHLSVIRSSQVVFGFVATQNLALTRSDGQWRISGGDVAELSEVVGQWPPAQSAP